MDTYLHRLTHDESELSAGFPCCDCELREWFGLEARVPPAEVPFRALAMWQESLLSLREREATSVDAAQLSTITKHIEEANARLEELS